MESELIGLTIFNLRLLGFEGISEKDGFPTWVLEKRIADASKS